MEIKLEKVDELEAKFNDISGLEDWREYVWGDGSIYKIEKPKSIFIRRGENGDSHRLIDEAGICHYVPVGWVAFRFQGKWGKL